MYHPPMVGTQIFSVIPQIANPQILGLIPQSQIAANIWVSKSQISKRQPLQKVRKSKKLHKIYDLRNLFAGPSTFVKCKLLNVLCYPCASRVCSR
jgi:hypothetical protein